MFLAIAGSAERHAAQLWVILAKGDLPAYDPVIADEVIDSQPATAPADTDQAAPTELDLTAAPTPATYSVAGDVEPVTEYIDPLVVVAAGGPSRRHAGGSRTAGHGDLLCFNMADIIAIT